MDRSVYRGILITLVVASLLMIFFQNSGFVTGHVSQGSTFSNVSIQKYLAISFSTQLANGIYFGSVASLPATNINGTQNYAGPSNATQYYLSVSNDSNTQVDFCVKVNAGLTDPAADVIGLGNETYSTNVTSSNMTIPALVETPMTLNYTKAAEKVAVGQDSYWRFWLDIPAGQASGDYNNSVYFRGVQATLACGQ